MRHLRSGVWGMIGLLALGSCVAERPQVMRLSLVERLDCTAKGGVVQPGYLGSREFCRILPGDIGKSCSMAGQCQEICAAETRSCQAEAMRATPRLDEQGQVQPGGIE